MAGTFIALLLLTKRTAAEVQCSHLPNMEYQNFIRLLLIIECSKQDCFNSASSFENMYTLHVKDRHYHIKGQAIIQKCDRFRQAKRP